MRRFLLVIALVILGLNLNAQSTIIDYDGYSLKFTVTNESAAECCVSCSTIPTVETELTLPSSVTIEGATYNVTSIEDYGFHECEKFVGDLVIPNSVTEIGDRAFRNCTGFNGTLTLSENIESIGEMAFGGGSYTVMNFTGKLTIPNSLEYIGTSVFQNCAGFTSLEFEEDSQLASFSDYAFFSCTGLSGELIIPNSVTVINYVSFYGCTGLASVRIPNSVTTIEDAAFNRCSGIATINIPNSVTTIGNEVLVYCENLESVIFDDNMQIEYFSEYFLAGCAKLKTIEIPESVRVLKNGAFYLCYGLENIEIPSGVIGVGTDAFNGCSSLSYIKCYPEMVPILGADVFIDCLSDMKIYVPDVSVEAYKAAPQWNDFTILPMSAGVISFDSDDESAFNVYPNPTSANAPINLGATFDRVEVYNAAGAKVAEYRETDNITGIETSGVYFIKAVADDKVRTCRIVVK